MVLVVHAEDLFEMGFIFSSRSRRFCKDLTQFVPIDSLGGLWWYARCRFSGD